MNLCMELITWVPTRTYRPKFRQSTQRIVIGGQNNSFSGSSCNHGSDLNKFTTISLHMVFGISVYWCLLGSDINKNSESALSAYIIFAKILMLLVFVNLYPSPSGHARTFCFYDHDIFKFRRKPFSRKFLLI